MSGMSLIKTIIADDHIMFRNSIRSFIDNKNNIIFLDAVENGEQLVDSYFKLNPDVIIVDIEMPVMSGTKAVEKIRNQDENVKALFLSMYDDEATFYQVIKAGGKGLIGKAVPEGQLINAIWEIYKGAYYFNGKIDKSNVNEIIDKYENRDVDCKSNSSEKIIEMFGLLSPREKEFINLMSEGLTRKEMAEKLCVSVYTYDNYEKSIKTKLNLASTPQLTKFAYEYKYLKKEQPLSPKF